MSKLNLEKIIIKLPENREIVVNYKTKVSDILSMVESEETINTILGVRTNNEIRSYEYEICRDSTLEYVKYDNIDGYRIYTRTVKFILYMAITKLYPNVKIEFCNTIDTNHYFISKEDILTEEMVENIFKEMKDIVSRGSIMERRTISTEEAEVLYELSNNTNKLLSLKHSLKGNTTMYFCENMYNYLNGVLAPNASYIKTFEVQKYRQGFVILFPKSDDTNEVCKDIVDNKLYNIFEKFEKYNDMNGTQMVDDINNQIINGAIGDTIRVAESIHEKQMCELMGKVETKEKLKIVLIAGPSSSGKTTFAQKLGVNLKIIGYNPITISMDNYFKERAQTPKLATGEYDYESLNSLDVDLFNNQIKDLVEGKEVNLPIYDFIKGTKNYRNKMLKLGEKDILVIEGIHALNTKLGDIVDNEYKFRIYIAPITTLNIDEYTKVSSTDTRMLRRIIRDYATRGHSAERTLEMWALVKAGEEKNIYPFLESADYIFNTSLIYEIGAMKPFAEPLLLSIDRTSKYFSEVRRLYGFLNNFLPVETKNIPVTSILREFIGDGSFSR